MEHSQRIQSIQEKLQDWKKGVRSLEKDSYHQSNVMRLKDYKKKSPPLGLSELNHIIQIDPVKKRAWVEPAVTMEQLVDATLAHGLIPPVVPEFKGITVGGAVLGAAIESSSHRYGQFNDNCSRYELLLGDGSVIFLSKHEHPDLFYGIASTYGSLGALLSVEIELIPAKEYVRLEVQDDFTYQSDYVEGIIFQDGKLRVITGTLTNDRDLPIKTFSKPWDEWFYAFARDCKSTLVPLKDYLFRHDRGAFWMGGYGFNPTLLYNYIVGKAPQRNFKPQFPNGILRGLFGWMMGSQNLYASLHRGNEKWFEEHFVIQDFYIPMAKAQEFITEVKRSGIYPLWLCPVKGTSTPQTFSPHLQDDNKMMMDVGIYGLPEGQQSAIEIVKHLEELAYRLGGRKMFYAYNYLSEEDFWKAYPYDVYQNLRKQTLSDQVFVGITDKVLHG